MNLAILIGHFPPGAFGGAELQAEGWAVRLADRHRVVVVTRRDPPSLPVHERRDGFEVVRLPVTRLPLARTVFDLHRIARAVEAVDPRPDLLLCFQTFISGLAGVRLRRRLGIPAVVWIRSETEYELAHSLAARTLSPWVWRRAAGVLVQSEENRERLLTQVGRAVPALRPEVAAKLDVVPNGLKLPGGPFGPGTRVLAVGRLIPDKGVDVVVDAVAGVQGRLTVVGDGPERPALEARARRHALDARFEGFVDRTRLEALYREASCVVLAARRGEGLPNVLIEAMAYARPVIATPIAGARGLVLDGVNGLIVPPDDPLALRDALARLRREPELAARLGAAARVTAERFDWSRVRPLLESALERRRSR